MASMQPGLFFDFGYMLKSKQAYSRHLEMYSESVIY